MAKKMKWLNPLIAGLTIVAGAVHVLSAYNTFDVLGLFGVTIAPIVQIVAGISAVWVGIKLFK